MRRFLQLLHALYFHAAPKKVGKDVSPITPAEYEEDILDIAKKSEDVGNRVRYRVKLYKVSTRHLQRIFTKQRILFIYYCHSKQFCFSKQIGAR